MRILDIIKDNYKRLTAPMRVKDVRDRVRFVFLMFGVYVLVAHVPLPGLNREAMENFFQRSGGLFDFLDLFAGGSLKRLSVLSLGIMPYINASIIFQLLAIAIPSIEKLQEDSEGRQKIATYTRYLTVGLSFLQGFGMTTYFRQQGIFEATFFTQLFVVLSMAAGTAFLYWLGEQITEHGIGQGVSLIIFAGIMTGLPAEIGQTIRLLVGGAIYTLQVLLLIAIFVLMVLGIVYVQQAARRIFIQGGSRVVGQRRYSAASYWLPLKVNQAGVIPIIFAVSVALFPSTIANFLMTDAVISGLGRIVGEDFVQSAVLWVRDFSQPGQNHMASAFYFFLVIVFTYFYTAVVFDVKRIAKNLRTSGSVVPGIRAGAETERYLDRIMTRITLAGALFLGVVALTQYYVGPLTGVQTFTLVGGTSLLIVVGVALDTIERMEDRAEKFGYEGRRIVRERGAQVDVEVASGPGRALRRQTDRET